MKYDKTVAQSLGLIIPRGQSVSGHVVHAKVKIKRKFLFMKVLFIFIVGDDFVAGEMVWWRVDRMNGWVAGIASHGSGFLSRGGLDTVDAPVDIPGTYLHYTATQLIHG